VKDLAFDVIDAFPNADTLQGDAAHLLYLLSVWRPVINFCAHLLSFIARVPRP